MPPQDFISDKNIDVQIMSKLDVDLEWFDNSNRDVINSFPYLLKQLHHVNNLRSQINPFSSQIISASLRSNSDRISYMFCKRGQQWLIIANWISKTIYVRENGNLIHFTALPTKLGIDDLYFLTLGIM